MPCTAHYRVQRITQRTLERVVAQPDVHLHVPDSRLDGASSLDHGFERPGDAPSLSRTRDAHALDLHAPVALVHDGRGGGLIRASEDTHLLQRLGRGLTVIGVARHGAHAHHRTFLERGGDADLHAKLIRCPGLALGDALHLGCVQCVQLVLVFGALGQDAAGALQQILNLGLGCLGQRVQLTGHLAVDAARRTSNQISDLQIALDGLFDQQLSSPPPGDSPIDAAVALQGLVSGEAQHSAEDEETSFCVSVTLLTKECHASEGGCCEYGLGRLRPSCS